MGVGAGGMAATTVPAAGTGTVSAMAKSLANSGFGPPSGFQGQVFEFDPVEVKGEVNTVQPTSAGRASATETVSRPAEQEQSTAQVSPAPTMEDRATAYEPVTKPTDPQAMPQKPSEQKPTDQSVEASREKGPLDQGRHIPKGERPNPFDPHEKEKQELNDLLLRIPSLSEKEQERVIERVQIWKWREKEKHPDKTDVIGEYGRGPRHLYEKEQERQSRKREWEAQMRVGANVANNPLAGSVSLYLLEETGDAEKAAAVGELFQVKGGKGARARAWVKAASPPRAKPPRSSDSAKGKGTAKRKPPPKKSTPLPPKLNRSDIYYRDQVMKLSKVMEERARGSRTLAIIVVEKNGKRELLLSSSLQKLPPEVEKAAGDRYRYVRGTGNRKGNPKDKKDPAYTSYHHAEHTGISAALSSGYKIIAVYPSKPACAHCGGFRDMGFTVIDPR